MTAPDDPRLADLEHLLEKAVAAGERRRCRCGGTCDRCAPWKALDDGFARFETPERAREALALVRELGLARSKGLGREQAKDVYGEGVSVGLDLGRRLHDPRQLVTRLREELRASLKAASGLAVDYNDPEGGHTAFVLRVFDGLDVVREAERDPCPVCGEPIPLHHATIGGPGGILAHAGCEKGLRELTRPDEPAEAPPVPIKTVTGPRPASPRQKAAIYAMLRDGALDHDRDGPIDVEAQTIASASRLIDLGTQRREGGGLGFARDELTIGLTPAPMRDAEPGDIPAATIEDGEVRYRDSATGEPIDPPPTSGPCPECRHPTMPYGTCHACGRKWGACAPDREADPYPLRDHGLIHGRYQVRKGDGSTPPPEARYFVLRYDKDDEWGKACRAALRCLAARIAPLFPVLAMDLLNIRTDEEPEDVHRSLAELRASFELRWKADMRAIERWRAEAPEERELLHPDHADLCCWLLAKLEEAERA